MSTNIGHFEILSELAKSASCVVYKANDPQSGQTIALKAIQLSAFGVAAADLEKALLEEAESTKVLNNPNVIPVYGAGEIEGQFCAAMEYVQGNSIATMLARKEGFSIWDLLDIGRQVCAGLDHAHSQKIFHYSLEPSKIMCGWDGTVKILSYGVSGVGKFIHHISAPVPSILHYMSPEQIRGEDIDGRSNLFSLGAMFYEMVTDRKAFDREDSESLRQSIVESTPVPPMHLNPKVHPLLNDLIMKALDKDPAQRYQSGRELLDDLEKCKESKPQAAKKPAEAPKGLIVPDKAKAAVQAKFVGSQPQAAPAAAPALPAAKSVEKKSPAPAAAASAARQAQPQASRPAPKKAEPAPPQKAAAAAAGWGSSDSSSSPAADSSTAEIDRSKQFVTSCVKATIEAADNPSAYMSAAGAAPAVEKFSDAPKIAVDPMMAEGRPSGGSTTSFSEISELPPLQEIYIAPEPPPQPLHSSAPAQKPGAPTIYEGSVEREEKPKIQPREVAEKAIKEIKGVPPKLLLYSLAGAVALILIIAIAVVFHVHSLSGDDDSGAARPAPATETSTQPEAAQPAKQSAPAHAVAAPLPVETAPPEPVETQPARAANAKGKNAKKKSAPVAAVVIPGLMAVDSTPTGAQVQIDGRGEASWVTPFVLPGLQPGQHSVTVFKAGYSTDSRVVSVASGNKASIVVHLTQLMATLAVTSDPAGASIFVDGRDSGKVTPAQVSVDKGQHTVLVRKMGYIDETSTAQFALGQTVSFSPTLRPLGNVDNIKTVGKMKKLFGGNAGQAGMATVSIHTQPKGAQISINQHMLEKNSPVDVLLDPGNYVIDIALTGYTPVHKVVTADKGGKVVVDETLQKQ
jgi:eukaryotic-like serine/threonine-protein kinase